MQLVGKTFILINKTQSNDYIQMGLVCQQACPGMSSTEHHKQFHWQLKGKIMGQATYIKERVDRHSRKVRRRKPWATEIAAGTACLGPLRCDLSVCPRVAMTVGRPMASNRLQRNAPIPRGSPIFPTGIRSSLRRVITKRYLL